MKIVALFSVILLVLMALALLPAWVPTGRVSSTPASSAKPPWRKSESPQTVAMRRGPVFPAPRTPLREHHLLGVGG
jgi:hypothetical protein